ncbi:MAG: oligosaccharide flippase family protein, partial [Bryobacteraceae bacterium]
MTRDTISHVAWNWTGVVVNLATVALLSPYIIRRLGTEGYGIWSLVFSIAGYFIVLDLGFRSAVVALTAKYAAQGRTREISELMSTTVAVSLGMSAALMGITAFLSARANALFHISAAYQDQFPRVVLIVGGGSAICFSMILFNGCAEGLQQFAAINKVRVAVTVARSLGYAALLAAGFGLPEMAAWTFATSVAMFWGNYRTARRALPALELSSRHVSPRALKEAASYGVHT